MPLTTRTLIKSAQFDLWERQFDLWASVGANDSEYRRVSNQIEAYYHLINRTNSHVNVQYS